MARLLLVDDESMLLDGILQLLRGAGYEAEGASSGEEALLCFERDKIDFDLVICDIRMRGMTGLEFWNQLWKKFGEDIPPFLFVSAKVDNSDLERIEGMKSANFLRKPFDFAILFERIQTLLDIQ